MTERKLPVRPEYKSGTVSELCKTKLCQEIEIQATFLFGRRLSHLISDYKKDPLIKYRIISEIGELLGLLNALKIIDKDSYDVVYKNLLPALQKTEDIVYEVSGFSGRML